MLVVLAGCWAVELAGGPAIRLPERIQTVARRVGPTGIMLAAMVVALAYVVLRNLG